MFHQTIMNIKFFIFNKVSWFWILKTFFYIFKLITLLKNLILIFSYFKNILSSHQCFNIVKRRLYICKIQKFLNYHIFVTKIEKLKHHFKNFNNFNNYGTFLIWFFPLNKWLQYIKHSLESQHPFIFCIFSSYRRLVSYSYYFYLFYFIYSPRVRGGHFYDKLCKDPPYLFSNW